MPSLLDSKMVPQAAMDAAHAAAVMVRAHGPDPKGRKMRRHAFFHTESGDTTLSASGFLSLKITDLRKEEEVVQSPMNQFGSITVAGSSVIVVTCASIVEPFLSQQPFGTAPVEVRDFPKLIPGAEIDVLAEVAMDDGDPSQCWIPAQLERVMDIPAAGAALQGLLDVHGGSVDGAWEIGWALAPVEGNSQLQGLGAGAHTSRAIVVDEPSRRWAVGDREPMFGSAATNGIRVGNLAMTATRVAILSLCDRPGFASRNFQDSLLQQACEQSKPSKVSINSAMIGCLKRGDFLLAVGSPFGALSPLHFHNSLSAGVVSNCWPPTSKPVALLMADVRCLPGMEGGPVFDEQGALVGMLIRPLRQRAGTAEVQLVMTSDVLSPALLQAGVTLGVPSLQQSLNIDTHNINPTRSTGGASSLEADSCRGTIPFPFPESVPRVDRSPAISRALDSVVLVTIGDGAWASGVVLSNSGLILTNAHLLEPWRFGKMRSSHHHTLLSNHEVESSGGVEGMVEHDQCSTSGSPFAKPNNVDATGGEDHGCTENVQGYVFFSQTSSPPFNFGRSAQAEVNDSTELRRGYQRIRIRLEYPQPRSWHDAKAIYVSKGPLDIALLQLVAAPPGLCPITPEESCPRPGSIAVVIGHGLFGPRAELCPSVSVGVVARVVKAGRQALVQNRVGEDGDIRPLSPAMLQTTAAVHPGGSGGAVVNSEGRMIGLVTSNARHSGGSVIPFLNFSVPFAALVPIFDFASKDCGDLAMLSELDKPDKLLSAVWALVPSTPPQPDVQPIPSTVTPYAPQLPATQTNSLRDHQKKDPPRGMRFAKFIAEKGVELPLRQAPLVESSQLQSPTKVLSHIMAGSLSSQKFCSRL